MHFSLNDLKKTKVGALEINQSLFALAAPQTHERERDPLSTLVKGPHKVCIHKTSVGYCVTIVSFRRKPVDDDNLITGAKPLRDAIATSLGIDDADRRFLWEYGQVITRGAEGTLVNISTIELKNLHHGKTILERVEAPARPRK